MVAPGRLIHSVRTISSLTLGSRVLGLIREALFGYFFATGELLSAFRIAFMVPNLARRLFGEGALSSAMIPVLTESLRTDGEESSRRFVGSVLVRVTLLLGVLVLVAEAAIFVLSFLFDDLALELAAVLMPYMAAICIVAVAGGVLNVRGHFAVPAAMPIILNATIIVLTLVGAVWVGWRDLDLIRVVCVAVLIAGAIQLLAVGLALGRNRFFPIFSHVRSNQRLQTVRKLMLPMVLGLSAVQLNALADYVIAYFFIEVEGERVGPAVLGFAQYLYQLPLGVFGIAVATAIFPRLSKAGSENDHAGLASVFVRGVKLSLFIALPASVGLLLVAHPLVAAIFQRGAFEASNTDRVAGALFYYSLGITAYFVQHLIVRAYYALQESAIPARVALAMVGVNLVLNLVLVRVMQERGLALATAVCACVQVVWLSVRLRSRLPAMQWRLIVPGFLRTLVATGVMAAAVMCVAWLLSRSDSMGEIVELRLGLMALTGVVTYLLAAWVMRSEELGMLLRR